MENSRSFKRKKEFMATDRRTRLTLHRRHRAAQATAIPFQVFIPGGAHHPIPDRRVSVQSYTKRLRRAGYVVKPTTQLLSARQIQPRAAVSATATCGISSPPTQRGLPREDLK